MKEDILVNTIEYRGYTVPIYADDAGQQFYTFLDGQEICFGSYNADYEADLKYLIDKKLDTIFEFTDPYYSAKLLWFDNNGYRDIKLIYRGRTLKIYLIKKDWALTNTSREALVIDATNALQTLKMNGEI